MGPGAPELPAEFVFTWLADPQPRRPEIAPARMPDFRLTEDERVALALYLGAEGESWRSDARDRHAGVTAADGAMELRVPKPPVPNAITLPVRLGGLNRRWTVGISYGVGCRHVWIRLCSVLDS